MLLFSLALLGQTVPLEADTGKAARQCLKTLLSSIATNDPGPRRAMAQIAYFSMTEAATSSDDILQRGRAIVDEVDMKNPGPLPTLAACDARFPLARTDSPAKLPTAPTDRDYLCFGVTMLTSSAAQDAAAKEEISRQEARFGPRMMRINAAKKLMDEASQIRFLNTELRASLQLGNLDTLFQACASLPD
jgi:hypothetical protein